VRTTCTPPPSPYSTLTKPLSGPPPDAREQSTQAALDLARAFRTNTADAPLSAGLLAEYRRRADLYDGLAHTLQAERALRGGDADSRAVSAEARKAAQAAHDALKKACSNGSSSSDVETSLSSLHYSTLAEAGRRLATLLAMAPWLGPSDPAYTTVEAADWALIRAAPDNFDSFVARAAWHIRKGRPLAIYNWVQKLFGNCPVCSPVPTSSLALSHSFARTPFLSTLLLM